MAHSHWLTVVDGSHQDTHTFRHDNFQQRLSNLLKMIIEGPKDKLAHGSAHLSVLLFKFLYSAPLHHEQPKVSVLYICTAFLALQGTVFYFV